jgi:hypothetical protein
VLYGCSSTSVGHDAATSFLAHGLPWDSALVNPWLTGLVSPSSSACPPSPPSYRYQSAVTYGPGVGRFVIDRYSSIPPSFPATPPLPAYRYHIAFCHGVDVGLCLHHTALSPRPGDSIAQSSMGLDVGRSLITIPPPYLLCLPSDCTSLSSTNSALAILFHHSTIYSSIVQSYMDSRRLFPG